MKKAFVVIALGYIFVQGLSAMSLADGYKAAASSRDAQLQQVMAEINGH